MKLFRAREEMSVVTFSLEMALLWELLPNGETLLLSNTQPCKLKQPRYPYIARAKGSRGQLAVPTPEQRAGHPSEPIEAPATPSPRTRAPALTPPEVLV